MNSTFFENINLARAALRKSRLRTLLSVLGTAIGIMSIIVIMSAGKSLREVFIKQLESFGTDYIQVEIKVPNTQKNSSSNAMSIAQGVSVTTLTLDDKKKIDQLSNIKSSYGAVVGQASSDTAYNEKRLNYFAVTSEFMEIDSAGIKSGRFFDSEEDRSLAKVVVLGSEVARIMFPNQDPIGQSIKIQKVNFRVIGVMNERGSGGFANMDEWIFIPLRTAQKLLLGFDHLLFVLAKLKDVSLDTSTAQEITVVMRESHEITDPNKDDFSVTTQAEGLAIVGTILSGITLVLSIIASIALLVGGVGIMNIMYVAVNERVFEIGLRKALGATMGRIRQQFLAEAVIITLIGGVVGIILALIAIVLLYFVAHYNGFNWPFAVSFEAILLAVVFSSLVGLFFGYYPAKKASLLKPVVALNERGTS